MRTVTLRWTDQSTDESEQRIYRSETPFDADNLPAVHATVGPNVEEFIDTDVERDKTYYYRIGSYRPTPPLEKISELLEVSTVNSFGPGTSDLLYGGVNYGFFGEVPGSELITMSDLTTRMGVTEGIAQYLTDPWLKFVLDGKILFVSKRSIRHTISWDHLHLKKVVYGDTSIFIKGREYQVRLLRGADIDPTSGAGGHYAEGSHNSEWSRLFYPLVSDDQYLIDQYTGPKYPSYTNMDLGMEYVNTNTNGTTNWCQETVIDLPTVRVARGYRGVSHFTSSASSVANTYRGWRPALELVT